MRIIPEIKLTLDDIKSATFAISNYKENATVGAIVTNSNEALPGDLFIALPGEKMSGEDFINEAIARGAFVMSAKFERADLFTSDNYISLLDIASYYKSKLPFLKSTVAITGSVGKTTTKNILARMLSTCRNVHSTKENYNNFLGLFHTILTAPVNTEVLIAEIGMNHPGEISLLSKALSPDISIITNIGSSHIGNLGSRARIAAAKLEILDGMLTPRVIVPNEEELLSKIQNRFTVSKHDLTADTCIIEKSLETTHSLVDIYASSEKMSMQRIALPGSHIVSAVAFSVEAMVLLGVDIKEIKSSLEALSGTNTRGKFLELGSLTLYDDTYSSSPEAVFSDFELLSLHKNKKKSCVLGDMLELGDYSEKMHEEIGRAAVNHGFEKIFTFGKYSDFIKAGAESAGLNKSKIFVNKDITKPEYTARQIFNNYTDGEIILFKASHSIHAERIIKILTSMIESSNQK